MKKENFKQAFINQNVSNPNWPREMKIMNSLVAKYPEENFWRNLSLDFKLNSLAFFNMEDGQELLAVRYIDFKAYLNRLSTLQTPKN